MPILVRKNDLLHNKWEAMALKTICRKEGRTLVCYLDGELDLHSAVNFKKEAEGYINNFETIKNIVLDLRDVSFVDSSGLGAILGRYKQVQQLGGQMMVVGIRPNVRRIFELSGLLRIIDEAESEERALAAL